MEDCFIRTVRSTPAIHQHSIAEKEILLIKQVCLPTFGTFLRSMLNYCNSESLLVHLKF